MSHNASITQSDCEWMLRLAADVAALPACAETRRRHLLTELSAKLGAAVASVFDASDGSQPGLTRPEDLHTVHTTADHHQALSDYLSSDRVTRGTVDLGITQSVLEHGTVLRRQHAEDRTWYRSGYYDDLLRPWGMDDQLSVKIDRPDGGWSGMCLIREKQDRPFTAKDRAFLALFHRHAGRLYVAPPSPRDLAMRSLPPRLRPVLRHLLDGDAEKQIALKLGLSKHTIHAYAKDLYRRYDASSRGELLARFTMP